MNVISFLREQIQQAHEFLEATMEDVTPEQAHWTPPGTANPLAATYVHTIASEDAVIHLLLQKSTPLYASGWVDKTGVSEIQPRTTAEWASSVRVDLSALRHYAQAVHVATDTYLAQLSDDDLVRVVDLSNYHMGQPTIGHLLNRFLLGHIDNMCGEISCLKGLQGARGYPI